MATTRKPDMTPFYRRILTDSWKIALHHKHLWVFGFFATLIGFGGVTEVLFSAYERTTNVLPIAAAGGSLDTLIPGLATLRVIASYAPYPEVSLIIFFAVFALLFAVFAWVTIVSAGGLVGSIRKILRGGEPTFGDGVKMASERFGRLFGLNVLAKLVSLLAFVLTGANLYVLVQDRSMTSGVFYVGSFVLFTAIAFVAALVEVYGTIEIMAKNETVEKTVNAGLTMAAGHWLVNLEMAVLLFLATLGVGACAALGALVLSVPVIFLIVVAAAFKASTLAFGLMTMSAIMLLVMIVCLGAFLTTFQTAAWTLLWTELNERKPVAKLLRLAHTARHPRD